MKKMKKVAVVGVYGTGTDFTTGQAVKCRTLIDGSEPDGAPVGYHSTDIYRISRMIYKFQRMEEYMVIRVWNDSILDHMESEESRQSLMTMLLGPGS